MGSQAMSRLKDTDDFGNRMKAYEAVETSRRFNPMEPIYARIDGRAFSSFTRGMERPFDARMTLAMIETTKHLLRHTHARIGYTQSDEISLVWQAERPESDVFFSGKILKMASVLASLAAAKFMSVCPDGYAHRLPHFDCRVFGLPSRDEAANVFLWRAMDAKKNAISQVAQSVFPHKSLHYKDQYEMLEMLSAAGIDLAGYPAANRLGSFVRQVSVERELSAEELAKIPEAHWPSGPVIRSDVVVIDMPRFNLVSNRVGVIFDGETPKQKSE